MVAREAFQTTLNQLHDKLIEQSNLCEQLLGKSIIALTKKDMDLCLNIIEADDAVDSIEEEINDTAIWLIAKEQPVSIDLRRIIVAIKVAAELERVADYSVNIAKATIRMGDHGINYNEKILEEMVQLNIEMLQKAVKAYHEEDVKLAKEAGEIDDKIDALYNRFVREILLLPLEGKADLQATQQLAFVARYIERSADHVTNILENIVYLVKGKKFEFNS